MLDQLIIFDLNEKIVLISDSVCNVFGYKQEELLNKHVDVLFGRESFIVKKIKKELGSKDYIRDLTITLTAKDKTKIEVSTNVSRIRDNFGKVIGYLIIMRDVTETNRLVDELKQKTDALEQSKSKLEAKNIELESLNKEMVGRELEMRQLKDKIGQG
jgi:PAS domain S-box-containing protein